MIKNTKDKHSAGEQALGYLYQSRYALLRILQLSEDVSVLLEKEDDIEFIQNNGSKDLASLKHKAKGDRLSNLSVDFWKSVNIWLDRYTQNGGIDCTYKFFLFTTSEVSDNSFLTTFDHESKQNESIDIQAVDQALLASKSDLIDPIREKYMGLVDEEKEDFLSRITLVSQNPRINEIPEIIIKQHMRTVRREFREPVYERLESWWNEKVINLLCGESTSEINGHEVSDRLYTICDEYKSDNLPINFKGHKPEKVDPDNDSRLFVIQLREIDIGSARIQTAIYDYYRAFQQRSSWARENVLIEGEVEEYEERLIEEWERYQSMVFETLEEESAEEILINTGKELFKWVEFGTDKLRIRERVSEPYVVRGNFHILANHRPVPRVYWHPRFLERLEIILDGASK